MATQIMAREFRDKQKSIFDCADNGEKIIIRRGKKKAYLLVPLEEEADLFFTPQMYAKIDKSIEEVNNGECVKLQSKEDLAKFLEKL